MKKMLLFDGIFPAELKKIRACLHAREKHFEAGNTLMSYGVKDTRLGVIIEGEAELIRLDYDGHRNILRRIKQGEPFGNLFIFFSGNDEIELVGATPCTVLYFDYDRLMRPCSSACEYHSQLISNIVQIQSQNMMELSLRIDILSQRTTRAKLLTYFEMLVQEQHSPIFDLPMSLSALSSYLFIDRSAMQRELKKLRDDGIIVSKGKRYTYYKRADTSDT